MVLSMKIWDDVGFVYASEYRTRIVRFLLKNESTPGIIARETGIRAPHVSRTLSQLEKRGIVKCLTPNRFKGKIFALTPKGIKIIERIEQDV